MHKNSEEILAIIKSNSLSDYILTRFVFNFHSTNFEELFEQFRDEKTLFYFSKPTAQNTLLGIGKLTGIFADEIVFASAKNVAAERIKTINESSSDANDVPLVVGAEKFLPDEKENLWEDYSNSNWFIPKILLHKNEQNVFLVFNLLENDFDSKLIDRFLMINEKLIERKYEVVTQSINEMATNKESWVNVVNVSLQKIEEEELEKIVLSRRVNFKLSNDFDFGYALSTLQSKYPDCITFAYKESDSVFFGATPEKLFSINDNKIETEALAGSSQRNLETEIDRQLEDELLSSEKNFREHKSVLEFIVKNLEQVADEISYSKNPQIKKLSYIQHLQTPVKAVLKQNVDVIELMRKFHPTPAVCGLPKKNALQLIKDLEYFDRGLYAGVIGWLNENKMCEFAVALRSAILKKNEITAYAGCGIVAGSDPDLEFNETELKLKPILSLLNNESKS